MSETPYIEDGHKIVFRWESDLIKVDHVICPFDGSGSAYCNRKRDYCAVRRFVGIYGPELNTGTVVINGPVEIGWAPTLGECEEDKEFSGIWVIPLEDESYLAMKRGHAADW